MAATRPVRRRRKKTSNPLWTLLGFIVCVIALIYATAQVVGYQARKEKLDRHYEERRAAIKQWAEEQIAAVDAQSDEWSIMLKKLQQEGLATKQMVQEVERKARENRERLADLEQEKQKIDRQVRLQLEDRELVGEGVEDVRDRALALKKNRDALIDRFKNAYVELKGELRKLVDDGNPDRVRQFFFTNRSTALAPAAAFFAADMYYEDKKTQSAVKLYEDLLKQFPDSPYTAKAQKRIGDINMKLPYDMYDPPQFYPYKIPDSLDFGEW